MSTTNVTPADLAAETRSQRTVAIEIRPAVVARAMACIIALLLVFHAAVMYAWLALGYDTMLGVVRMFDVAAETNIPTWYASMSFLACALVLALIAAVKHAQGDAFRWQWAALSVLFVFLSVDEASVIHETFQKVIRLGFDSTDSSYALAGLLFPAILGVIVLFFGWRWMLALPKQTLGHFVLAALIFGLGAVGVDFVSDYLTRTASPGKATVAALRTLEETLEMAGVAVFMYGLLTYLGNHGSPISIRVPRSQGR